MKQGGSLFGKRNNKARIKQAIPEFAEVAMLWGIDAGVAMQIGEKMANDALNTTNAYLEGMEDDTNLAALYFSGTEPRTTYSRVWLAIMQKYQAHREADGVTDEDMLWYWSMPLLEREFILQMSNAYRMGFFTMYSQSRVWNSQEELFEVMPIEVNKATAWYSIIGPEELDVNDPNRPFPLELYKRIETYRNFAWDESTKKRAAKHPSLNSFLREQMALGIF